MARICPFLFCVLVASPSLQIFVDTGAPPTYGGSYDVLVRCHGNRIEVVEAINGDSEGGWGDVIWSTPASQVYIESYVAGNRFGQQPVCVAVEDPEGEPVCIVGNLLNGDFDLDDDVDLRDYALWIRTFTGDLSG